ncbi:WD40 repeat domain-containing protein [Pelotomaculum propionicicum]|uniref:WD40 repeat domain-containing protein n=1 Tax=Pelotomaculum propionicicum TaxID=258475 RepID=UPI003B7BF4EC
MNKKAVLIIIVLILMSISITGCNKGNGNEFIGNWVSDKNKTDIATISRNGNSFFWEDKDGKFPATYKDGILTIHTGLGDIFASINNKTGKIELSIMGKQGYTYSRTTDTGNSVNTSTQNTGQTNKTALNIWSNATRKFGKELNGEVNQIAFSPDGKTFATGAFDLMTWDVVTGKKILDPEGGYLSLAYSLDGKMLASLCSSSKISGLFIKIWDAVTGQEIRTISGIPSMLSGSIAISPDGKKVAVSGQLSYPNYEIKFWDIESGKAINSWKLENGGSIVFSPDGKILALISTFNVTFFDVSSGNEIKKINGPSNYITSVAFSSDWKTLALGGHAGRIGLYDLASGKELKVMQVAERECRIDVLAYYPDGSALIFGGCSRDVNLLDLASGQSKNVFNTKYATSAAAVSPDGKCIAAGDKYGYLEVWAVP